MKPPAATSEQVPLGASRKVFNSSTGGKAISVAQGFISAVEAGEADVAVFGRLSGWKSMCINQAIIVRVYSRKMSGLKCDNRVICGLSMRGKHTHGCD